MRILTIAAALLGTSLVLATGAFSDEDAIQLKPGVGAEVVQANCAACHSLDYVQMNSPFLDEKGWTNEVTKMVKTFGAPVTEVDQQQIIAYLTANYGKPPS